jgi:protoheme IX farnesyltransferase
MQHLWQLIRPGLLTMVLFSMTVAALTAGRDVPPWTVLVHALVGTALVIAGAGAMNQRLEWRSDAKMIRTARRPLPARGITGRAVSWLAAVASIAGLVYLAAMVGVTVSALAAVSWIVYVLVYTPSKRLTAWQTPIGAVAGAMPMLLGAAAAGATLEPTSAVLFAVVFFWQFPHTMAVAWIYRQEFAAGGIKVATVVDPTGRAAGRLAVFGATGLWLVSLVPTTFLTAGWAFGACALVLGVVHLGFAARFLRRPDDATARALWHVSLVHLPLLLVALLVAVRC